MKNWKRPGRSYKNLEISLEKDTKILFYTDGLIEAVPEIETGGDFESEILIGLLQTCQNLTAEEIILKLSHSLISYHGSDEFEDDVCMICLNVR